ncbi:MAG: sialate O-acetylesterase [Chitinophagaceae bacterium]|nr:sialate O-acetylesterase [Chitinophagaceae bacterium]
MIAPQFYSRVFFSFVAISLFFPTIAKADIKLPWFFSDNMVMQQQTDAAVWGWAKTGTTVTVTTSWNKKKYNTKTDNEGKWKLKVATPVAGGPYTMTISDGTPVTIENILIGEVWLCSGQSNMEMAMKGFKDQPILGSNDAILNSANDNIRMYTVPRSIQRIPQDTSKNSVWKAAEPEVVSNFSATAYFFGKLLYEQLRVPIGLVNISYGGSPVEAFMDDNTLKAFPEVKIPSKTDTAKLNNKVATVLYNGMLKPFLGYTIKGCIWYQGESNNDRPQQYETLFPAFVRQIREQSGQGDFPFYFCQIAPYNYNNHAAVNVINNNSAYLRDAQRKALAKTPNSGMAVLMDIGEEFSIHPMDKATGSKRLAYMALAKAYGKKGFACESPAYESVSFANGIATIKFANAPNGLTSYGMALQYFEIAGSNKVFRPAKANISGGNIIISSPDVKEPVAVRYAFKDFVTGELFSTEGFPVSSFRTDEW